MAQDAVFLGRLLLLREKEFVERAIHARDFAKLFRADQIHRIEGGVEGLQPAQIAMIQREILQETSRNFGAFGSAAARDFAYGCVQTGGGKLAMLLNHALDTVAFRA